MGDFYILGNGKEDSIFAPRKINNEKVFKGNFPKLLALGTMHVSYCSGVLGDISVLNKIIKESKKVHRRGKKRKFKEIEEE